MDGIIALIKQTLIFLQPLMDKAKFDALMAKANDLESAQAALLAEEALYPNWDDSKIEALVADLELKKTAYQNELTLLDKTGPVTS